MNWLEIEKKFLVDLNKIPFELNDYQSDEIEQWYLFIDDQKEERIRHRWNRFYYTTKTWIWEVRWEDEHEISKDEFYCLWPKTLWFRLEKIRYLVPYKWYTIELDVYRGNLTWLSVAEIEFESKNECDMFEYPDWFGEDVTDNPKYKNRNLINLN